MRLERFDNRDMSEEFLQSLEFSPGRDMKVLSQICLHQNRAKMSISSQLVKKPIR